ncbi:MAG: virginiamycin B lyase family protein [Candidatus Limnocylindria bacterium]
MTFTVTTYPVPAGSAPHDVAPAGDGGVWYTAQQTGELGWLDPDTEDVREVALGPGSAPHGVIVGPDGAPWITDSGLNAIVRVDPETFAVTIYPLPSSTPAVNLNTAAFDGNGILWFTGQAGYFGRLDPASGAIQVSAVPRGPGPYGITATPAGHIFFSSLAGSYVGQVNIFTGAMAIHEPPGAGARRVWSDSRGRLWVAEWFAGQVAVLDPATGIWREWRLPGPAPQAYAVYVDETDAVWLTDFGANAIVRFDPVTETFQSFPLESQPANVRQLLGRPGEVWGAESAADQLVVVRFGY